MQSKEFAAPFEKVMILQIVLNLKNGCKNYLLRAML